MIYSFRKAKPEEVYQLITDVHGTYCAIDTNRITWYVCETRDKKVSYIGLLFTIPYPTIYDIGTIKNWRRRRAAIFLLNEIHEAIGGCFLAEINLENEAAVKLFEKAGYEKIKPGPIATYLRVPS